MKKRNLLVSILAGVLAGVMLLTLIVGLFPASASAASSSEIRNQINQLKKEKEAIKGKIKDVEDQYKENENEIADIIARKNVVDQQIQLLTEEIVNTNEQILSYNILIADKQDELDNAENHYDHLSEANKVRVRAMEEEGEVSYWEVLFKANSFSDLLDRLNMVEEIAAADRQRLQELSDARDQVGVAQDALATEKGELEAVKADLAKSEEELAAKQAEAEALLQELLARADELEALKEEFQEQEAQFLDEIAKKEVEYDEAKQREWEAYMATYVPPTQAPSEGGSSGGSSGGGSSGGGSSGGGGGGGWVIPMNYSSITSPFGYRTSPTAGASSYHQGVDLDGVTGQEVFAAKAGRVVIAGTASAPGHYVSIDHGDGIRTIYMHLNSFCVSAGQMVSAGQVIGTCGKSGIATGDHLHFGLSVNGVYVNPANYVPLY